MNHRHVSLIFRSLRAKTLLWASIPVALLLTVVVAVTPPLLEEMARTVAQQRDVEIARILAERLSEKLTHLSMSLQVAAADKEIQSMDPSRVQASIEREPGRFYLFDGGIAVYDGHGTTVWARPNTRERQGTVFPMTSKFEEIRKTLRPAFSDVFKDPVTQEPVVLVGVPIVGNSGEFAGVLAGMATIKYSLLGAMYAKLLEFKEGRGGFAYLLDGNGRVIYHRDPSYVGRKLDAILPVREVVARNTGSAVIRDRTGETIIVGYAPVPATEWGLVTQETWDIIVQPVKRDRARLLALLVLGGLAANVLILLAVGRILRPIRQLTAGAKRIADGDFEHHIDARTGDEIQILSDQFNLMADALKRSYGDLERRVQERTRDLALAKEKAEDAERVKSAFLATMSHELRTPLNSIIGFNGMVLQGVAGPINDEQRRQLTRAYKNARHLLAVISDILDLSKIEAGKLEIVNAPFNAEAVVRRVAETVGPPAAEKGLQLTVVPFPDMGAINSDERRVEQVLINLANNAVKYTDRGEVRIEGRVAGDWLEMSVSDTGIGIRREDIGQLFQPFRQLEAGPDRKREGTGLGLAICDRLVAMLGGKIQVRSERGTGSTFTFSLPLRTGENNAREDSDRGRQ